MIISTSADFKIAYSLYFHEFLGYLIQGFALQLDEKGDDTFVFQHIWSKNTQHFESKLDEIDFKILTLIDTISIEGLAKMFDLANKKLPAKEFLSNTFHPEKGNVVVQSEIVKYVDRQRVNMLQLLITKQVYLMSNDGLPMAQKLEMKPSKASVLFHFMRNPDNTHYFPTIKYEGEKVDFIYKNAVIISLQPAWMLLENKVFYFEKNVDGKKIQPFLSKKFILIPQKVEEEYYRKFVANIIANYDVHAKGFDVILQNFEVKPVLKIAEIATQSQQLDLFGNVTNGNVSETKIKLSLCFVYGEKDFVFDSFQSDFNVFLTKDDEKYTFHKIKRNLVLEKDIVSFFKKSGLAIIDGKVYLSPQEYFTWINEFSNDLENKQIEIVDEIIESASNFFLGVVKMQLSITENKDWFDIHTIVKFGEYELSFWELRNYVLNKITQFKLPNGKIAFIPDVWFEKYQGLFALAHEKDTNKFVLDKHHFSFVKSLENENLLQTIFSESLDKMASFQQIDSYEMPKKFDADLRIYQKSGYDWMRFLNEYKLGGCLADDMGLGKTVMTLALLQQQKERNLSIPSLVVMPTSLLYNWFIEAKKFAPHLKVLIYHGATRDKNIQNFNDFDLVFISYGLVRSDVDLLNNFDFDYVILDESQTIKNPEALVTKAVNTLKANHKLILTGTPLENSILDLWSQMNFANPGLLGSLKYFKTEYQNPIEKEGDELKKQRLNAIIKPFMLRRKKSQVALDLPDKIENIHYVVMPESQAKAYEKTKSLFRNELLQKIETEGVRASQMLILQGLTMLRQIANHPKLTDPSYTGESGKQDDVLDKIETIIAEGHKVLIFSQFTKQLQLYKTYFDEQKTSYCYLDGSTTNRQSIVDKFQTDESIKVFLISIKAGGVGLNLTAAEYVFILDPWWNPAVEAQAVDRAHRIGQENTVFTYKFITKDTVEEKILQLQESKKKLADELISTEESFFKNLTKNDLLSILD
ncbi:MAG: DEAD/DEAH box helicase [Pseudarcicella sp.]|nr:DEAD/DEAH box helicase [Pseudarcicella sp.]MBP6410362.1 DEAD/DEAH box helicase [Pseudarcicella sp.]